MKKLFVTAILVSGLSIGVFASDGGKKKVTTNTDAVSYTALNQFEADFTGAKNIVWTVNANCQKADFTMGNVKETAFYSLSGEYLGVTRNVNYKVIPAQAQKSIAAEYASYNIGEVIELQPKTNNESTALPYSGDNSDAKVYFVDLKNGKEEILVRVTPSADVYFFKQVK